MMVDPRAALDALIRAHGEDYAAMSKLVGRNAAYIQQYIRRGSPRRLGERERRVLADYFRVPEARLGGEVDAADIRSGFRVVARYDVGASAGPGALADDAAGIGLAFPEKLLRELVGGDVTGLSLIRVAGDSMVPTLADGDDILVDTADAATRLRDGIYVLRADDTLIVKRLSRAPTGGVAIRSDNRDLYPDTLVADPATLAIIGRVVWVGRKL